MFCNDKNIKDLLPAYLAQDLDAADRKTVEQHLAVCPDCAEELALLRTFADETVPDPGEAFWNAMPDRIYRVVQQEKMNKRHFNPFWFFDRLTRPRWVMAAATSCVLLAVSFFAFHTLQQEPDTIASQGDLYPEEMMRGSINMAALDQNEITTIDAWAGHELASIAQEAGPLMINGRDMNLYEELAVLDSDEVERLSHMITELEEEA